MHWPSDSHVRELLYRGYSSPNESHVLRNRKGAKTLHNIEQCCGRHANRILGMAGRSN